MKSNAMKSIAFSIICMLLGILIALQMKNVNVDSASEKSMEELTNSIIDYSQKNTELNDRNAQLSRYLQQLESDYADGNTYLESILKEKERAAIFAGLREVRNYGITIRISSSPGIEIRDSVLRSFVNELATLGAQAMSINDERLVATSEIRQSNHDILINGTMFERSGLFEIKAITDPKDEDNIFLYLDNLKQTINEGLGADQYTITIEAADELTIPALSEDSAAFRIDLLTPVVS